MARAHWGFFNNYLTFSARLACVGGAIAYGSDPGAVKKDDRGMSEAMAVGRAVVRGIKRSAVSEGLAEDTRQSMPPKNGNW